MAGSDTVLAGHGVHRVARAVAPSLSYRPRTETTEVILHASHTTPAQSYLKEFLEVKGRRMGLLTIGYHYVIMRDGFVLCTRPHTAQGSHCPGYNQKSIGVCLAGGLNQFCGCGGIQEPYLREVCCGEVTDGPEDNFTPQQGEALGRLIRELEDHYGPLQLWGHSEKKRYINRERRCPPTDMNKIRDFIKP